MNDKQALEVIKSKVLADINDLRHRANLLENSLVILDAKINGDGKTDSMKVT